MIVKKCYILNLDKIQEPYLYESYTVTADNHNQAKYKMLEEVKYDDIKLINGDDIKYTNIPIKRYKDYDKIKYNNKVVSRTTMNHLIKVQEHNDKLDTILNDISISHCYIKKRGVYYRDKYCGYTDYIITAGVYSKQDAVKHCKDCIELSCIPIDVDEHTQYINEQIKNLTSKLI